MSKVLRRERSAPLTIQQIHSLIVSVKSYPCIWNPNREENIRRSTIAIAWAKIAERLRLPEDVVRAKWKNLRDLFMRESKKTNATCADDYHGKWRHFKRLWFLNRVDSSEPALSEDDGSEINDVFEPARAPYEVKIESLEADVNDFVFLDTEQVTEVNKTLPGKHMRADRNSKGDRDGFDISQIARKRRRMTQVYADDDSDMMFLMSLSPYFKLLKPIRKLMVRNKMQDIIFKEIERNSANGQL